MQIRIFKLKQLNVINYVIYVAFLLSIIQNRCNSVVTIIHIVSQYKKTVVLIAHTSIVTVVFHNDSTDFTICVMANLIVYVKTHHYINFMLRK